MKINSTDLNDKTFIIAEIGNNHEGSYSLAEEMIGLAAEAGVDAVKFQTFKTELYINSKNKERFEKIKSFELSFNEFEKLSFYAKKIGLSFISTPFDIESASFLSDFVDALKISSGDNNFFPLIKAVSKIGKPLIVSTGLADIDLIKKTKKLVERTWSENNIKQDLALLHCVTAYPVDASHANLNAIKTMQNIFDCTIGYSDHTLGKSASIAAVCLGAKIIEKHFTIDKNHSDFRDHQLSSDPKEMRELVESIRKLEIYFGDGQKKQQPPEIKILSEVRRSIVAKKDLTEGDIVKKEDINWVRPSGGMQPGEEYKILGKTVVSKISKGENILEKYLK
tara:strand:+ start:20649 stop:21659 length:1011 start_codon:yes stop_codon:yes gene_type:complete